MKKTTAVRGLVFVAAAGAVIAAFGWLVQRGHGQIPWWPELMYAYVSLPMTYSPASAVAMGILAVTIARRKRMIWWALLGLQCLGLLVSVISALGVDPFSPLSMPQPDPETWIYDFPGIAISLCCIGVLLWLRSEFVARLRRGSFLWATVTLLVGTAATVGVTWLLVAVARPGAFNASLADLVALLSRALGLTSPGSRSVLMGLPPWLPGVPGALLGATSLATVWVFLHSGRDPQGWSLEHERELRGLIARFGAEDSLSYFATRRDRSTVFCESRQAAVTYRVFNGVCVAAADPIGERAHWPAAIRAWLTEVHRYGWVPAVISASEAGAKAYVAAGLRVLRLGDEAVLTEAGFARARAANPKLRRAIRHVAAAGVSIQVRRQGRIPEAELMEIATAADAWRRGRVERGFSMALGRESDPADQRIVQVTARSAQGELVGLLSFVPWGPGGLSLDVMRRSPEAPHGINQAMVAALLDACPRIGIKHISLNFCMFRGRFETAEHFAASPAQRLGGSLLGVFDRFWQLERLYRANRQYDPLWVPRYLLFTDDLLLPQVAIAAGMAEGFLPAFRLGSVKLSPDRLAADEARLVTDLEQLTPQVLAPAEDTPRLRHLLDLESRGGEGYPAISQPGLRTVAQCAGKSWRQLARLEVVGRVAHLRNHGGVVFVDLCEHDTKLQLRIQRPAEFSRVIDIGDLLRVEGTPGTSASGDDVLDVEAWQVAAKSLRTIRLRGWRDAQARALNRSEDLLTRARGLEVLQVRSRVLASVRSTLVRAGFWEVETPVLHPIHGGASARPFNTHLNAYHQDLSLRIAPELYLKRLLVAGSGPIFEVSRNFRNEGVDATHNPEFTSVEAYLPFADYSDMRLLTQDIVREAAIAARGEASLQLNRERIDLSGQWPVVSVLSAVSSATGTQLSLNTDLKELLDVADAHAVAADPDWGPGRIIEELYSELVEPKTIEPTFYVDFPAETSPLTRPHPDFPGLAARWDLVVGGLELGTAYTELTDPRLQRERLTKQSFAAAAGDLEAMQVDEDFLRALELGMPPTGGLGMGLDRLVMILTGEPIRSVLSFPFTRTHGGRR